MRASPTVLVIGGSDSSGGAGITRDVAVLTAFHVEAAVAITAVTAQTDQRVSQVHHVPPHQIAEQINTAFAARVIAAVKIGMLGCQASLEAVLQSLPADGPPVVLDPVLAASSGRTLLDESAIGALRSQLIPRATLLTPNLPEAAILLESRVAADEPSMVGQLRALRMLGAKAVLLKSGHGSGVDAVDLLLEEGGVIERLSAPRLATTLRGTGCMLAAAIAAGLVTGKPLLQACEDAKKFVTTQLQRARAVPS